MLEDQSSPWWGSEEGEIGRAIGRLQRDVRRASRRRMGDLWSVGSIAAIVVALAAGGYLY